MTSYRGAQFGDVDFTGAVFRESDLSGVRMHGVLLFGADIDGAINGLRVNGVEVAPLIEAELDRLHPVRLRLRPDTVAGARDAVAAVREIWAPTLAEVTEDQVHVSVDSEWSLADTLRHLVFVHDAWFGVAVLGERDAYHPVGLPASFFNDYSALGLDPEYAPSYEEVLAARADRLARLDAYLETATQEDLDRIRSSDPAAAWPPPGARTAWEGLRIVFNEEWTHHQFAIRDLAKLKSQS